MIDYKEWPFLEVAISREFPSYSKKCIVYGSHEYNQLLDAKTILALYGYKRFSKYFDVVCKDDVCFNIVSDENGFYLKQLNFEAVA